jgi:HD superfamily phosphohydrolase
VKSSLEIRDPIHGPIAVNKDEMKIIDSAYVQRLRGIKQTGFAELAFPGATHNRYSHSLGAFHLAGKAFDRIFDDFEFSSSAERSRLKACLRMGALLHDIGHGPLSHAIEQAMPARSELNGKPGQATHEDYTEVIIRHSPLTDVLNAVYGNDFPINVISIIRGENENPDFFKAGRDRVSFFPIFSSLISGELDVDRMDYLVRDSLFCGIPYGQFDRDWIFSNLLYQQVEEELFLALDSRAIYALEDFLLSRYHMYLMVYLHHKSVVYDEMLFQFLKSSEEKTRLPSSVEDYLKVDDHWLMDRLRASQNPWARKIIEHKPYRMLLELHSEQNEEAKKYADELEQKLLEDKVPYFRSSSTGLLSKYLLGSSLKGKAFPIYIIYRDPRFTSAQTPGATYEALESATPIFERYQQKKIIDRIFADV